MTLCSTTSGDAAGKVARTLTRVGASCGRSSRPKPEDARNPNKRINRPITDVSIGRLIKELEKDNILLQSNLIYNAFLLLLSIKR